MIKINGTEYEADIVSAENGSMRIAFATSLGLNEIEAIFLQDPKIEIIEDGETIAKYYNKGMDSIAVSMEKDDVRKVEAYLSVSEISEDAEKNLTAQLELLKEKATELAAASETTDAAIVDLADSVSANNEEAGTNSDAIAELAETLSELAETVASLSEIVAALTKTTDQVTEASESEDL